MPKDDRKFHLDNFDKYRNDLCFNNLANLLSRDTIYSVFQYREAPNKHGELITMNRAQANIISTTNLIVLDVDNSEVPMQIMHEYLQVHRHIIATTSDVTNKHKFRILLPINVELDGSNTKQFNYITKRIAADLLIDADKVSFNTCQPFYGYAGAEIIQQETGQLFDITEYLTGYASGEEQIALVHKPTTFKTKAGRDNHVNKIIDNAAKVFSYVIEAESGRGSFELARASLHMRDEKFTKSEYIMVMNYINQCWENPMEQGRFEKSLLDQFTPQMEDD
jgi:hypothetical protein